LRVGAAAGGCCVTVGAAAGGRCLAVGAAADGRCFTVGAIADGGCLTVGTAAGRRSWTVCAVAGSATKCPSMSAAVRVRMYDLRLRKTIRGRRAALELCRNAVSRTIIQLNIMV